MKIEKLYLTCLSHASYILSSNGEAVIVDPQRDVDDYLKILKEQNLKLKYIFETHLHADFVSGHLELSRKTGADIVFGHRARAKFEHISVREGDKLILGNTEISILETPGHTPEGVCYLVKDLVAHNEPMVIFTGDTLFAGDVGRPDLMDETMSATELGELLYNSLRNKIMVLPDETKVYPAHGAGSSCGRALTDVEFTTIGIEKESNYALQMMDKETFIEMVTNDQPIPPIYFKQSAILNMEGLKEVDDILKNLKEFTLEEFSEKIQSEEISILDVRSPREFSKEFIPGSFNIGLEGRYAEWVGSIMNPSHEIIIVGNPGDEQEATIRAARVGYDKVIGYLSGGFQTWKKEELPLDNISQINTEKLERLDTRKPTTILDVRKIAEFRENHVIDAKNIPLVRLQDQINELNRDETILIHCKTGYRSVIASSILKKNGFREVINITDGIEGLMQQKYSKIHLHN